MKKILSIICCALFLYACEATVSEDSSHTVTDNNPSGGVANNPPSQDGNPPTTNPDKPVVPEPKPEDPITPPEPEKPSEPVTPPVEPTTPSNPDKPVVPEPKPEDPIAPPDPEKPSEPVTPPVEENPISIDKKYWGRWLHLEDPEKEEFLGKDTKPDVCKPYDDDLLECTFTTYSYGYSYQSKKYLVRAGESSLKVSGSVTELGTPINKLFRTSGAGFGSLGAILSISRTDKNGNKTEYGKTETKDDGTFEFSGIPSGDYVVNIEDDNLSGKANVSLNYGDVDMGVITAVQKNSINFKTELLNISDKFLFADYTEYRGTIRITNTGDKDAEALSFDFSMDDPSVVASFSNDVKNRLIPLLAGQSVEIGFKFSFKYMDDPKKTIKMNIRIEDAYRRTWDDYVSFDVFGHYTYFKARSEQPLKGFLSIPGQKMLTVKGTYIDEKIPYNHGQTYTLTLVNAELTSQTKYSFAIGGEPIDYTDVQASAHEPNDTKDVATSVSYNESIKSYLSRLGYGKRFEQDGDIDRFNIVMNSKLRVERGAFCDGNNGELNSGETAYFGVAVKNTGHKTAEVSVLLSLSDPYITLTKPQYNSYYYVNIAASATWQSYGYQNACIYQSDSYSLVISKDTPLNHKATIKATVIDKNGYTWEEYLPIIVNPSPLSNGIIIKDFKSIDGFSYAKTDGGKYYVWGNVGELAGKGNTAYKSEPIEVKEVVINGGTYYVLTDKGLYAGGDNTYGQVGNGSTSSVTASIKIADGNIQEFITIGTGSSATYYAVTDSGVYAWGSGYSHSVAKVVSNIQKLITIGSGSSATYYAITDTEVYVWGAEYSHLAQNVISGNKKEHKIIGLGDTATYYVLTDAGLYAWGNNDYGQVGNGSVDSYVKTVAKVVNGNIREFITNGIGSSAAYYAITDVDIYAWGYGYSCSAEKVISNVQEFVTHSKIKEIIKNGSGDSATYYVITDAGLFAWGYGFIEGDGGTVDSVLTPIKIADGNITGITVTGSGSSVSCSAITDTGLSVSCYPFRDKISVLFSAGSFSYAETENGKRYIWGNVGKLTDTANLGYITEPRAVNFTVKNSLTVNDTYYVLTDAGLYAWGDNYYGQVGNRSSGRYVTSPVQVLSGNVKEFVVSGSGSSATYYVLTDAGLYAWGRNNYRQVGNGSTTDVTSPVQVLSGNVKEFVVRVFGSSATCYVLTDAGLYAWGNNDYGQVGNGSYSYVRSPVQVLSDNVKEFIVSGSGSSATVYAITDVGLYAWGYNYDGQVGNGSSDYRVTSPAKVLLGNVKEFIVSGRPGFSATYYVLTDAGLYAWGKNFYGQVGNGSTTDVTSPEKVIQGNVKEFIVSGSGSSATYYVLTDAELYAWGYNGYGQVGNGSTTDVTSPAKILSGNVKSVTTSGSTVYAITDAGLYAWGYNGYGQVGNGSTTDVTSPAKILSGNVKNVVVNGSGSSATYYVLTDAGLYAWGYNYYGQVGNGSTTDVTRPQAVVLRFLP